MWVSASSGCARLLSEYAIAAEALAPAEIAIALSEADPQSHYARAAALIARDQFDEASTELEHALKHSPRDYYLWLKLGRARDWEGNPHAARAAYEMAARLAPFYASPRWELGNLLLRQGEREQAFAELRRASESNTTLLPGVIDLAGETYAGDVEGMLRSIRPRTTETQLALSNYFARRGMLNEALELLNNMRGDGANAARRTMLRERLEARRFGDAHQVWLSERGNAAGAQQGEDRLLNDGGFEDELVRNSEPGFGWRLGGGEAEAVVKAAHDANGQREGARSLKLEWGGDSHPALPVLSQLCVVKPGVHYRLSFAARTEDLVSGGPAFIAVADATEKDGPLLGQSPMLPRESQGWRDYSVEFTTRATTEAVVVYLRRQCATEPCPIYGRMWLDAFSLRKL